MTVLPFTVRPKTSHMNYLRHSISVSFDDTKNLWTFQIKRPDSETRITEQHPTEHEAFKVARRRVDGMVKYG